MFSAQAVVEAVGIENIGFCAESGNYV